MRVEIRYGTGFRTSGLLHADAFLGQYRAGHTEEGEYAYLELMPDFTCSDFSSHPLYAFFFRGLFRSPRGATVSLFYHGGRCMVLEARTLAAHP
jgi:hypothetical protein